MTLSRGSKFYTPGLNYDGIDYSKLMAAQGSAQIRV